MTKEVRMYNREKNLFNSSADRVKVSALARVGLSKVGGSGLGGMVVIWGMEPGPHVPYLP